MGTLLMSPLSSTEVAGERGALGLLQSVLLATWSLSACFALPGAPCSYTRGPLSQTTDHPSLMRSFLTSLPTSVSGDSHCGDSKWLIIYIPSRQPGTRGIAYTGGYSPLNPLSVGKTPEAPPPDGRQQILLVSHPLCRNQTLTA